MRVGSVGASERAPRRDSSIKQESFSFWLKIKRKYAHHLKPVRLRRGQGWSPTDWEQVCGLQGPVTGWLCGMQWDESAAWAAVSECSVVATSQDLSDSVVTLPTQADAWTRSSTLECKTTPRKNKKTPPSVLALLFFPHPLFPFHAESRTFCSLSFLPTFSFLSLLHLIFSHFPSPPLSVVSCSTCPPPPPWTWCLKRY